MLIELGWTPDHHKKPLKDLRAAGHGKFVRKRMKETDVLVIDEISMVENLHFERLNAVMKEARNDERAFGGVQLIVTGDVSWTSWIRASQLIQLVLPTAPCQAICTLHRVWKRTYEEQRRHRIQVPYAWHLL